jgi:hypothetical protein
LYGEANTDERDNSYQGRLISSIEIFQRQIRRMHLLLTLLPLGIFIGGFIMSVLALIRGEPSTLNYLRFGGGIALSVAAPFAHKGLKYHIERLYRELTDYLEKLRLHEAAKSLTGEQVIALNVLRDGIVRDPGISDQKSLPADKSNAERSSDNPGTWELTRNSLSTIDNFKEVAPSTGVGKSDAKPKTSRQNRSQR